MKVSIVYKDNFSEDYNLDYQALNRTIREVKDESKLDFYIGEKQFIKKEIAIVATPNCSIRFL